MRKRLVLFAQAWCAGCVISCSFIAAPAVAAIASDNAGNAPYSDFNWTTSDNGGIGFAAWSTINNQSGSGSGGGFIGNNNGESQINTSGRAFGIFGHSGGVGQAIRPFASAMNVGERFSIDMDNGFINSGGTVGFGLQTSLGTNLVEFFFVGGDSSYKVNRLGGSVATGDSFTNTGLRVQITLTSATTFALTVDKGFNGVDSTTTGSLMASGSIARMRLFNANAGQPNENNAFYNNFLIEAIPEPSAFGFLAVATGISGANLLRRKRRAA